MKASKKKINVVTTVKLRQVRISPRKARLAINLIKGRHVQEAIALLDNSPTKAARIVGGLLRSGLASADENHGVDTEDLWVAGGWVDMGKTLKRWMPRAQGRATPIRKRASHITLQLGVI